MENNRINSCGCRQQTTNRRMSDCPANSPRVDACPITSSPKPARHTEAFNKIDTFPLGIAYVPMQHYDQMFPLSRGLKEGTIFPELCLPFCGRRGKCSC